MDLNKKIEELKINIQLQKLEEKLISSEDSSHMILSPSQFSNDSILPQEWD